MKNKIFNMGNVETVEMLVTEHDRLSNTGRELNSCVRFYLDKDNYIEVEPSVSGRVLIRSSGLGGKMLMIVPIYGNSIEVGVRE